MNETKICPACDVRAGVYSHDAEEFYEGDWWLVEYWHCEHCHAEWGKPTIRTLKHDNYDLSPSNSGDQNTNSSHEEGAISGAPSTVAVSHPETLESRLKKIAWLLRSWRGGRGLREVSAETGIGISTLSRYEGGRAADDETTAAILKLLGLTWEELDQLVICWYPQPCRHERVQYLTSVDVKEQVASSWFVYDDDGYPNEVFGDKTFYWDKHYDVCLDCGQIRSFDGYSMYDDFQVPGWIKKLAKDVLRSRSREH